jgi:pimeloyl-ACP methyl ester carboxylesterase
MKQYIVVFYRLYLQAYFFIAPNKAAYKLLMLFATPRIRKLREYEQTLLAQANQQNFTAGKHEIVTYTWGKGEPDVLLVHGWEGHGGNMAGIANHLVQSGHTCLSFDAPAHGKSFGKRSTLFTFSECVSALLKEHKKIRIVLSHSFGSAAAVYTLSRMSHGVEQLILLSAPDTFSEPFDVFYSLMRLTKRQREHVNSSFKKHFQYRIDELQVSKDGSNTRVKNAVLLHDRNDAQIKYACAERVAAAWPQLKLIPLEDVGHYKMLWNEEVMKVIEQELIR